MHLGKNNVKIDFEIEDLRTGDGRMLDKTVSEKDQGIIIRADKNGGIMSVVRQSKLIEYLGCLKIIL